MQGVVKDLQPYPRQNKRQKGQSMDNRENLYRMIAGNIRKERERLYITQAEFAARLDYSANASCSGSRTGNLVFGGQADGDRAGFGSDYGLSFVWDNGSTGGQISEMSCQ